MDFSLEKAGVDTYEIIKNIDDIEKNLLCEEQVNIPIFHHFYPGLYLREMNAPAGTFLVGHAQKCPNLCLFLKGKAEFIKKDGSTEVVSAPTLFLAEPGRKVALAIEDMVFINVYPTDETNLEKIEEIFFEKTELSVKVVDDMKKSYKAKNDNESFDKIIESEKWLLEKLDKIEKSENPVKIPYGIRLFGLSSSPIHGKGLFTTAPIKKWSLISKAFESGSVCEPMAYINHSCYPTAELISIDNDWHISAKKDLNGCSGGFYGDEITIDYMELKNIKIGVK